MNKSQLSNVREEMGLNGKNPNTLSQLTNHNHKNHNNTQTIPRRMQHFSSNISRVRHNNMPAKEYDGFKTPADLDEARDHGKSQRVCRPINGYRKDGVKRRHINSLSVDSQSSLGSPERDSTTPLHPNQIQHDQRKIKPILNLHFPSDAQIKQNTLNGTECSQESGGNSVNQSLKMPLLPESNMNQFSYQQNHQDTSGLPHFGILESENATNHNNNLYITSNNYNNNNYNYSGGGDGSGKENDTNGELRTCDCCGFVIDNEILPIDCSTNDFVHLGVTFPLYFDFIKKCAMILIVHFFMSSLPSIIMNLSSSQCSQFSETSFVCHLSFLNVLVANQKSQGTKLNTLYYESLCNGIFLVFAMILICVFQLQQKIKKKQLERYHCSISDYSVFITDLPHEFEMSALIAFLHKRLNQKFEKEPVESLDIIKQYKLYDLKEYANLYENKVDLMKKKIKLTRERNELLGHTDEATQTKKKSKKNNKKSNKDSKKTMNNQGLIDQSQLSKKDEIDEEEIKVEERTEEQIEKDRIQAEKKRKKNLEKAKAISGILIRIEGELAVLNEDLVKYESKMTQCRDRTGITNEEREIEEEERERKRLQQLQQKQVQLTQSSKKIEIERDEECKNQNDDELVVVVDGGEKNLALKDIRIDVANGDNDDDDDDDDDDQVELKFSQRAILTFNDFKVTKKVLQAFKMNFKEKLVKNWSFMLPNQYVARVLEPYMFEGELIKVGKAPEPTDILWANIGFTKNRIKGIVVSTLAVYSLIFVSFLLLLFLKRNIKDEQSRQSTIVSLLLSFAASTIVAIFNSLLGIVIRKGANYEKHHLQTRFFVSVGKKLTRMFIVNMVVSTLMSNTVKYYLTSTKAGFPFDASGLMNDFFFLFITNSYIGSIFNIFDIVWGVRLIKRSRAEKDPSSLTQMEANQLFEGHPIDMALRYANVNKTVLFTASVSPFIPIGVPLSIVGLLVTFWVDKYLLLRRYVCKNYISFDLAKSMMKNLKIYVVFFSFGNMLTMFMPVTYKEYPTNGSNAANQNRFDWSNLKKSPFFYISILGFVLSLAFRYFPLKGLSQIYNRFFKEKYQKRDLKYSYLEIESELEDDYDYYHPILKEKLPQRKSKGVSYTQKHGQKAQEHLHNLNNRRSHSRRVSKALSRKNSEFFTRPQEVHSHISTQHKILKQVQHQVDFRTSFA